MHRENLLSTLVYVLMIGIAVGLGLVVVGPAFGGRQDILGMSKTAFILLSLFVSIILNVVLFEFAHFVGAKLGNYEVRKTNVLGFQFIRKDNKKTKFEFPRYYEGLTGETAIYPKNEKANPKVFLLCPLVVFVIEALSLLASYLFIKESKSDLLAIKYFLLILVTVGAMLFLYDYFPAKIDSTTDGFILTLTNKKENVEALNKLYAIRNDYVDCSKLSVSEKINDLSAQLNNRIAESFLLTETQKALDIVEKNVSAYNSITSDTFYESLCIKLGCNILLDNKEEIKNISDLMGQNGLYYLRHCYSPCTIKLSLLYFGLVEKSEIEIDSQIRKIEPRFSSLSDKRYEEEIKEIKNIINIIKEKDNSLTINF